VRKVSIVARGMAGGYTMVVPDEDRMFRTKREFEDQLAYLMAGQIAEMLVFDEQSTGASNDIERATNIARRMVTEFGMSEKLGPLALGKKDELVFLGREISEQRNYSDPVAYEIDKEVRRLIDEASARARKILTEQFDKLEAIAQLLIREETIESEQFEAVFDQPRPKPNLVGPPWGRPVAPTYTPPPAQPAPDRGDRDTPPAPGQLRPQPAG
jgi:cell division protease FtsH